MDYKSREWEEFLRYLFTDDEYTDLAEFFRTYVDSRYYTPETDLVSLYVPALTMVAAVGTAVAHFIVWLLLTLKKKKNYLNKN
jgi:hypothetical protein